MDQLVLTHHIHIISLETLSSFYTPLPAASSSLCGLYFGHIRPNVVSKCFLCFLYVMNTLQELGYIIDESFYLFGLLFDFIQFVVDKVWIILVTRIVRGLPTLGITECDCYQH
uniref:Uncharacterized protein n=1 Tax=Cacopsylla melanoneura TaxID=428564 RepID=A0A8D9BA02_9HEMI